MKKTRAQANYALLQDARKFQNEDFEASHSYNGVTKGDEN